MTNEPFPQCSVLARVLDHTGSATFGALTSIQVGVLTQSQLGALSTTQIGLLSAPQAAGLTSVYEAADVTPLDFDSDRPHGDVVGYAPPPPSGNHVESRALPRLGSNGGDGYSGGGRGLYRGGARSRRRSSTPRR